MAVPAAVIRRVWFTVTEAEQYTGVSRKELYTALQVGELRGRQRRRNAKWRVHLDDLDRWMRGESTQA